MEPQMTDVLQQALPPYEVAIRFGIILLLSLLIHLAVKSVGRLLHAVSFPGAVLGLTFLATILKAPWGIDSEGPASVQIVAWYVFWSAVLFIRIGDWLVDSLQARRKETVSVPPLLRRSFVWIFYLVAVFGVLKLVLGIDITPLLATSAILTMVIGLALQGVLGNLLSGVSLGLVRTVEVGNLIGIGDREGIVVRTNWRETIIRTRDDDYVHVPNTLLASERITNYSKPEHIHRHRIEVGASYSDAPGDVIAALEDAARESSQTLDKPPPVAHLTGYLDFGINYTLFFWSRNYWRRNRVEGDVGRLIWYKFKRRGIEIPFPMSDELLNDFMAVVYNQRRLPPSDRELDRMTELLSSSRFLVKQDTGGGDPVPLLDTEAMSELAGRCRFVRYAKGETLCRQKDVGEQCYLIARGSIHGEIEYRERGGTHLFEFKANQGDLFGEMSLFTGMPRTATGRIREETELLEIPMSAFAGLLADHEEVMEEIASLVADRNKENEEFLAKIDSLPEKERVDSCDSSRILERLKSLALWGRKLVGRPS